ncbi:DUF4397 domain-containing protein [Dinghuibacter silviterrae]|uniref:DUF4397 domain-containing protein n=1 Tax=Dinghuibacter silviterrae TaxID=1539049 RepID=A0A4R8DJ74_9BACT|nr:DUF4397 domain-containing protein [Dinghuibacter silviterrae]TDW97236.1 hypothetical protein EDB95_5082 [Dinghuibacter silviterrae]
MKLRNLFVLALILQACVKSKVENVIPPLSVLNSTPSSIRLFNFCAYDLDVKVNNNPLTSFITNSTVGGTALGLSIFPSGKWPHSQDGDPWSIPVEILDKNGRAHITLNFRSASFSSSAPAGIDTVLQDDPLNPRDYYVMDDPPYFRSYPRLNSAPSQPQNVKIRIINLGQANDPLGVSGPVTLTYADGTPVGAATSNIGMDSTSGYIEVPYGAYEFKLFNSSGSTGIDITHQLVELPLYPNYNTCNPRLQEGIFPQMRTYKPGGVYSLVITPNWFRYNDCIPGTGDYSTARINAYRTVTEATPGVNVTFAQMQAVNALGSGNVTFRVDGQALGGPLAFGQPTDNVIYVQGTHQVSLLDAGGNVLVQKSITLSPYDYYTIWAYPKTDGTPDIIFAACDMSGEIYSSVYNNGAGGVDDGTNGSARIYQVLWQWQSRFLNLCPDVPYATFTDDSTLMTNFGAGNDGDGYPQAVTNLSPGYMPPLNPYILYSETIMWGSPDTWNTTAGAPPAVIRAYQSSPGPVAEVPGTLLLSVPPLRVAQACVANPALYSPGYAPSAEPGVYTTALVGSLSGTGPAARMIVIKHNK